MVYSAPINVVRYDNGTLIKLTASAHEFISYDFDAETKTGTFVPDAIVISAEYGGNVKYGKWQYSKTGESFSTAVSGEHGISFTANALTLSGDSDIFGADNSSVIIRLVGDDEKHADTITIIRTVDPLIVYDYAYTSIQQDRRKIALIASDEQLAQFRDSYTVISKLAEVDVKAETITQTVTANYATKTYAEGQAADAVRTAASDATEKARAARTGANEDTDAKLENYVTTVNMESRIQQTASSITQTVSQTYSTRREASDLAESAKRDAIDYTDNLIEGYSTTEQMTSAIVQKAGEITQTVSATYQTQAAASEDRIAAKNYADGIGTAAARDATEKAGAARTGANNDTDTKLASYSTIEQLNTAIRQTTESIELSVSRTYSTKTEAEGYASAAVTTADSNAENMVSEALSTANTFARKQARDAKNDAISIAAQDATDKSDAARRAAVEAASEDATTKAGSALSNAMANTAERLRSYSTTTEMNNAIRTAASGIMLEASRTYTTKLETEQAVTSANGYTDDALKDYTTKNDVNTLLRSYTTTEELNGRLEVLTTGIYGEVSRNYTSKNELTSTLADYSTTEDSQDYVDNVLESYTTTEELNTRFAQEAVGITSTVERTVSENYVQKEHVISTINQTAEAVSIDASKINLNGVISANETFRIDQQGNMTATGGEIGGWSIGEAIYSDATNAANPNIKYRVRIAPITSNSNNFIMGYRITDGRSQALFGLGADGAMGYYDANGVVSVYNYNGFSHSSRENGVLYTDTEMRPGIIAFYNADGRTLMLRGEEVLCGHIELTTETPYIDWHFDRSASDYTTRLIETSAGNLTLYGTLNQSSDRRLKKDIVPLHEKLTKLVDKLKAKVFRYKRTPDKLVAGLVAQEVLDAEKSVGIEESVLVRGTGKEIADPKDPKKTTTDYYSVDYNALTVMLLSKVQELTEEVKTLRQEVNELKKSNS